METIQYTKCYLEVVKIVFTHEIKDDLIFSHGAYFQQLAKNLDGKLISNEIQRNAPPDLPRVIIQAKDLSIQFALNRMQIEVRGSRKHTSIDQLYGPLKPKIHEALSLFEAYLNRDGFKPDFVGVLGPIRFPQPMNTKKEIITKSLSEKFSGNVESKDLVTFSTKLGYLDNKKKLFVNYEIQDYEVKNIKIEAPANQNQIIDIAKFPTVEHGVLINIDVNNRPRDEKSDPLSELKNVLDSFFYFTENFKF